MTVTHVKEGRDDEGDARAAYAAQPEHGRASACGLLEIFRDVQRHQLISEGEVVQTFEPQLTLLQEQLLELRHVPASVYAGQAPPEVGARIDGEKCGTSVPSGALKLERPWSRQPKRSRSPTCRQNQCGMGIAKDVLVFACEELAAGLIVVGPPTWGSFS